MIAFVMEPKHVIVAGLAVLVVMGFIVGFYS